MDGLLWNIEFLCIAHDITCWHVVGLHTSIQ